MFTGEDAEMEQEKFVMFDASEIEISLADSASDSSKEQELASGDAAS